MAQLNLQQIEERLDNEFSNLNNYQIRKLIFWYDSNGDFKEDINDFNLENAKIIQLTPTNQFQTKVLLERQDPDSSYLIYAPFEKPKPEENHLEDTYLYSLKFNADRTSLIASDLNISSELKPILDKYSNFFRAQDRITKFKNLELNNFTKEKIEKGIIRNIIGTKGSFREALRKLITSPADKQEKVLNDLSKFNINKAFWNYIKDEFGYSSENPELEDFTLSLYASTLRNEINDSITQWDKIPYSNPNDARIFLDSIRNNIIYQEAYNRITKEITSKLQLSLILNKLEPESFYTINSVPEIEEKIIDWITERLEQENTSAKIGDKNISELIKDRLNTFYGKKEEIVYKMLLNANELISLILNFKPDFDSLDEAFYDYSNKTFRIDQLYRKFYYYFDQLKDRDKFENLQNLVENLYTNLYMEPEIRKWNQLLKQKESYYGLPLQREAFRDKINNELKTAVIISDGLRYEIAEELFTDLIRNPKYTGEILPLAGMLPSYTELGMSSLLPHQTLEYNQDLRVLVDGKSTPDLKEREKQLQVNNKNNIALNLDDMLRMSRQDLRKLLNGKHLIYIYHNQVDSRGDKQNTENEVFKASEEAIEEIKDIIRKLSSANVYNFIITADHGFLYKRNKLEEMDKISLESRNNLRVNRRYVISEEPLNQDGIINIPVSKTFSNDDKRYLNFPLTQNVFKASSSGMNYVHGGSSPQESVVPFIRLKTERNKIEQRESGIDLFSQLGNITNLIVDVAFFQKEPVSTEVYPQNYKLYMVSEDGRVISNTHIFTADSTNPDSNSRIKSFRFELANIKYDRNKKYYIVAENENGIQVLKEPVIVDIAYSDDFGFFN